MVVETRADHPLSLTVDHLKARRLRVGLSQADLDHVAGFPSGRVAHWECGMQKPSLASLLIWAEALGCRLLLGGSPVPDASHANGEHAFLAYLQTRHIYLQAST